MPGKGGCRTDVVKRPRLCFRNFQHYPIMGKVLELAGDGAAPPPISSSAGGSEVNWAIGAASLPAVGLLIPSLQVVLAGRLPPHGWPEQDLDAWLWPVSAN
jgi:hypothetical protein